MTKELLPCPFCGGEAMQMTTGMVKCSSPLCTLSLFHRQDGSVVVMEFIPHEWNRRSLSQEEIEKRIDNHSDVIEGLGGKYKVINEVNFKSLAKSIMEAKK